MLSFAANLSSDFLASFSADFSTDLSTDFSTNENGGLTSLFWEGGVTSAPPLLDSIQLYLWCMLMIIDVKQLTSKNIICFDLFWFDSIQTFGEITL